MSGRKALMVFFALLGLASSLKVNVFGGYEDVVVTIGSDVPQGSCTGLLQGIRETFFGASQYLNSATNGMVYFNRVNVILPADWDPRVCNLPTPPKFTSASSIHDASFRVTAEHPVFGNAPYTQQSQGCGKPGDFISMSYRFFMNGNDSLNRGVSYPHRTIVHEWTKYRYGVFEERGFHDDQVYPPVYTNHSDGEVMPNFCTNEPLKGTFSPDCKTSQNCSYDIFLGQNGNISSSIMAVPGLGGVVSFCDRTTHIPDGPTKHNFQCMKASVTDVMLTHLDFKSVSKPRQSRSIAPSIVVKQIIRPRFVLLIEESGNMNMRDVWKYLKLAITKFVKYDLENGVQVGIIAMNSDSVKILANMTVLDNNVRGILAGKIPNYPNVKKKGGLSIREGISQSINMLKSNGARVAGSVIILISQGALNNADGNVDASLHLVRQEEISIATIEYPSSGDGKMAILSKGTNSPSYAIRESGVGSVSHLSTYLKLVAAMNGIQNYFFSPITNAKTTTLIHEQEFKGDARSNVESTFFFDYSGYPGEFLIYVPNPNDPKVNELQLISPSGRKFSDQLRQDDTNVIKVVASIDEPGMWQYRIERLGDSHQSHFVQVVSTGSGRSDELEIRVYSSAEGSRIADLNREPLILYADVKRGMAPVLHADVKAVIRSAEASWETTLYDSGNGDPDITAGDGVYSRYIIPPVMMRDGDLDISVRVNITPKSKYASWVPEPGKSSRIEPCCGSILVPEDSDGLKGMSFEERAIGSYAVKILNVRTSRDYKPSRVGNLQIVGVDDKKVTFRFSAPGDDFDTGKVSKYEFFYNENSTGEPSSIDVFDASKEAGGVEEVTMEFESYGVYPVWMQAVDPYAQPSYPSNVVIVSLMPTVTAGNSSNGSFANSQAATRNLNKKETVLLVVGIILIVVIIVSIIILCVICRRRTGKRDVNAADGNIYTISDTSNKEPIHWSASQLLQVHEKRLSLYGNSQRVESGAGDQPDGRQHRAGSPGSSTRSFRSFSEAQMRESFDAGRRPTMTDYDSCSSDPIIRGPTDYDTAVDSDTDNINYRTIDSYVGATYRATINTNPSYTATPRGSGSIGQNQIPVQYSQQFNSYQGSVTSINGKRRNVTMV